MNCKTFLRHVLIILCATTLGLGANAASAAIISVDTLEDAVTDNGNCSLREAVIAANTNTAVDDCPAGTGGGTDAIWVLLSGTISVTQHLPITEKVTILGGGKDATTVSGLGVSSVFYVNMPNDTHDITISNLTIADGKETLPGAGLLVDTAGTVRVENCRFRDNSSGDVGGAIGMRLPSGNATVLRVIQSDFEDNSVLGYGGAIGIDGYHPYSAPASVEIDRSEFIGNHGTENGGAVYLPNVGSVSIDRSRFHDNDLDIAGASNDIGGAVYWIGGASGIMAISNSTFTDNYAGTGGAVAINGFLASVTNSTFSGNRASSANGNALYVRNGTTGVFHSTFINNGVTNNVIESVILAGSGGNVQMTHSIVWSPESSGDPACKTSNDGAYQSSGYNIDAGTTCTSTGTDHSNVADPGVFDLGDYGDNTGALVLETFLPRPGGLAIDGGKDGPCTQLLGATLGIDQRGDARPVDGDSSGGNAECDIGAVEYQPGTDPIARMLNLAAPGNGRIIDGNGKVLCYTSISPCDHELPDGTIITLTASAYNDYEFIGWSGDCAASGTGDCTLAMDQNFSATANFQAAAVPATLQVSKSLAEAGLDATITSAPSGINCGATCSAGFAVDDVIVLTATPQPGTVVSGWTGCDSVSGDSLRCTITLAGDSQVEVSLGVEGVSIFRNGFEN
ncbi:MAG TPA: CSLREA domain-containing protein [Xanthomonadaceae bacterium]|nr:CSLREA domain-containing protein [Xanthomonadaceae bacterium]